MKRTVVIFATLLSFGILLMTAWPAFSRENVGGGNRRPNRRQLRTSEACLPSTSTSSLDINNVRALLQNGGDMWWDLVSNPRYEVPRVDNPANAKHSLFAGSLWVGGKDGNNVLRVAAMTYRQTGSDFFPGPLDSLNPNIEKEACEEWDRHFKINKEEIDRFLAEPAATFSLSNYPNVRDWPVTAYATTQQKLAPFFDRNNNALYEPDADNREHPTLFPNNNLVIPDQMIFWVINDKGDIHTETGGEIIGIEIQMLAFAFSTTNAVNDMTFYKQKVINRSTNILNECYIGQWVDADLGFAFDDWVGCDVQRGLGVCYNGDAVDDLPQGYGSEPPAVGVDFFQGPTADPNDDVDNDKDGTTDEVGERIGMAKFIYYNNDFTSKGNPEQATHFYGYLSGRWKNGSPVIDDRAGNGDGFPDAGESGNPTNFMFPDYPGDGCQRYASAPSSPAWSERSKNNPAADRRFIQSAGPFTLQPGATNEIVVGVVWARAQGQAEQYDVQNYGSFCKLLESDDIAQALFDSGFDLLNGPDAPRMAIEEFDEEIILTWGYDAYGPTGTNNYYENYREKDPLLINAKDPFFEFQGYIVYQLINDQVSSAELGDRSKARIVTQCDIKDNISTIINRERGSVGGVEVINDQVMVEGKNEGLFHSIRVNQDLFSDGDKRDLVNYRTYYFTVVAYAHNEETSDGRRFIVGNSKFERYSVVPHKIAFQNFGTVLNAEYGNGPEVTHVSGTGYGSGGRVLQITPDSESRILASTMHAIPDVTYAGGTAPFEVKVINPKAVQKMQYRLHIVGEDSLSESINQIDVNTTDIVRLYAEWMLYGRRTNDNGTPTEPERLIYTSQFQRSSLDSFTKAIPGRLNGTMKNIVERQSNGTIIDHGIAVGVRDVFNPGRFYEVATHEDGDLNNGFVDGTIVYQDMNQPWIFGTNDFDGVPIFNWILSGLQCVVKEGGEPACIAGKSPEELDRLSRGFLPEKPKNNLARELFFYDPSKAYENVIGGTWAPFILHAHYLTDRPSMLGFGVRVHENISQTPGNDVLDPKLLTTLDKLPNIDVVITDDRTKWSKCVVVETSPEQKLGSGAHILTAKWRKNRELSQLENANWRAEEPESTATDYGMSYFPGYAINVETGERVNLFFGESTWNKTDNGDDMLFNPTQNLFNRHVLYVTNERYDECQRIASALRIDRNWTTYGAFKRSPVYFFPEGNEEARVSLADGFRNVAWSTLPLVREQSVYSDYSKIPKNSVRINLRVTRSFQIDTADTIGAKSPQYTFNMTQFAPSLQQREVAKDNISIIQVVPNPYYGRSGNGRGKYERTQLDQRVKITNLPQRATIRILTLNGTLIRTYRKESSLPDQEWDLKNNFGVPIASGLYIIHVDAGELGEKVLKFFCIMPELDLNAY
jgi:hypothetical protein